MLPWLLAWARLIADEEVAVAVANEAVAIAASRPKRLTGTALRAAARTEATRLLARGVAAVPDDTDDADVDAAVSMSRASGHDDAGSRHNADARHHMRDFVTEGALRDAASAFTPPADATLTPTERLARALGRLHPYERLACVAYVLDGASTSDVAALLGVTHERAADILDRTYPTIAAAVGEAERPDFAALTGTQVEVVVR